MQLANHSPFPDFVFESLDERDQPIHCVLCKGTFIIGDDSRLHVAPEQEPVVLADRWRREPLTSSVAIDTDLVPRKLVSDITLDAVAQAQGEVERESWLVRVEVGKVSKSVMVWGPRQWQHSGLRGWHLSQPRPTREVPLHYELAFGGRQDIDGTDVVFEENPVGRGFVVRKPPTSEVIPAPQIEAPHDPVRDFGRMYRPVGVGPLAKHWLPRRNLCGTADDLWKKSRWPLRPLDFDFRYYNSASAGLMYPGYLDGNERVCISGCSPGGMVRFSLPEIRLVLFAVDKGNGLTVEAMVLDTLHVDLVSNRVQLTWRLSFPGAAPLDSVLIIPGPHHL